MYEFDQAKGWKQIEDYLAENSDDGNFDVQLEASGFQSSSRATIGESESGFSVELYCRGMPPSQHKYEYLVAVTVGDWVELIAVPDLPSLVELLHKLATPAKLFYDDANRLADEQQKNLR